MSASLMLKYLSRTSNTVFAKTAGLSDKTAKFRKCPMNFVSLPDSLSDENYNPEKCPDSSLGDLVFNG